MSRTVRDLVTINHLPGLLLASMPECERWIAAGLIPVAERRTLRGWGQTREAPMFDPKVVARLAAEVPAWRAGAGAGSNTGATPKDQPASPKGSAISPAEDAAQRRRQSILALVRKNTGMYIAADMAADMPRFENGTAKPRREF